MRSIVYFNILAISTLSSSLAFTDNHVCFNTSSVSAFAENTIDYEPIVAKLYNADFECPKWILKKKNLQVCPNVEEGKFKTLPETFDKAVISYSSDLNEKSVVEAIMERVKSGNKNVPVFSYRFKDKAETIKMLSKAFPRFIWKNHIFQSQENETFIRDSYQTKIDDQYRTHMFTTKDLSFKNPLKEVFEKCSMIDSTTTKAKKWPFNTKTYGGNFQTLVGDINISTGISQIHKDSGYTEDNTIVFPDKFSRVKHIDEILQPISLTFDQRGCPNITALIASPRKALELLKNNPDGYFFKTPIHRDEAVKTGNYLLNKKDYDQYLENVDNLNLGERSRRVYRGLLFNEKNKWNESEGRYRPIQVKLEEMKEEDKVKSKGLIDNISVMRSICDAKRLIPNDKDINFKRERIFHFLARFGTGKYGRVEKVVLKHGYTDIEKQNIIDKCRGFGYCYYKEEEEIIKYDDKYCENISSKDVYQVLNNNLLGDNSNFISSLTKLKSDVSIKLKAKYPKCKTQVDWIEAPVIPHKKNWAIPNMANAMPVSNKVLNIPEPYSIPFKDYMEKELSSRGIKSVWTDTLGLNNPGGFNREDDDLVVPGNVHCATNSIPICKPPK
jgi:hypothetical protein